MQLKSFLFLFVLFISACNETGNSQPESATSNQIPPNENPSEDLTCGLAVQGQTQEKLFYEASEVPYGEECRSALALRTCENGHWSEWTGTSFREENCFVANNEDLDEENTDGEEPGEEEVAVISSETLYGLAHFLTTCGYVSTISECIITQKKIFHELL